MKTTFAFLLVVFLAFSGYHLSFRRLRLPLFAQGFYLSGLEFLFLGVLLGPAFLDVLDVRAQKGLGPLVTLVLGWVGLVYGFQFELSTLFRTRLEFLKAAFVEGTVTALVVLAAVFSWMHMGLELPLRISIPASLSLAAVAASTGQAALALMDPRAFSRRAGLVSFIRTVSSADGVSALVLFGLAFACVFSYASEGPWLVQSARTIGVGAGACAALILLYLLLLRKRLQDNELLAIVIGMAVLASGLAVAAGFSPLLAGFVLGFSMVNLSREKERIYRFLIAIEKPAYLLILVFLGMRWRLESVYLILPAVGYCACRIFGKLLAGYAATRSSKALKSYPSIAGLALLDIGGLPLAILLDYANSFSSTVTDRVVAVGLMAVVLNEFVNPYFLGKVLRGRAHAGT